LEQRKAINLEIWSSIEGLISFHKVSNFACVKRPLGHPRRVHKKGSRTRTESADALLKRMKKSGSDK